MRPIAELAAEICTLSGHINAANHRFLVLIAEFDRRTGWSDGATQSCAHWLNWKCGIDLGAAGTFVAEDIASDIDGRHVEAVADAEVGNLPLAGVLRRQDLALDTAWSEARRDEDAAGMRELLFEFGERGALGVDPVDLDVDVVGQPGVGQRL